MSGYQGAKQFSRKGGGGGGAGGVAQPSRPFGVPNAASPPPHPPPPSPSPPASAAPFATFPRPPFTAAAPLPTPPPAFPPPTARSSLPPHNLFRAAPGGAGLASPAPPPSLGPPPFPPPKPSPPPSPSHLHPPAPAQSSNNQSGGMMMTAGSSMIARKLAEQRLNQSNQPAPPAPPSAAPPNGRPPFPPSAAAPTPSNAAWSGPAPQSPSPFPPPAVHSRGAPPSFAVAPPPPPPPPLPQPQARRSYLEDDWGEDGSDAAILEHLGPRRMLVAGSQRNQQQPQAPFTPSGYRPPPFALTQKQTKAAQPPPPAGAHIQFAFPLQSSPEASSPPEPVRRSYMTDDDDDFLDALDPDILRPAAPSASARPPPHALHRPLPHAFPPAAAPTAPMPAMTTPTAPSPAVRPAAPVTPTKRRYDDVDMVPRPEDVGQRRPPVSTTQPFRPDVMFHDHLRHLAAAPPPPPPVPTPAVAVSADSAADSSMEPAVHVKKEMSESEQRMQEQLIRLKKEFATLKRELKQNEDVKSTKEAEAALLRSRMKQIEKDAAEGSIADRERFARETAELKRSKEELERQVKAMKSEKEMLELELREKTERQHQAAIRAERDKKQPTSHPLSSAIPLALSQPNSQSRRSAPVAPAPSPSTSPAALSTSPTRPAPMDTSEEGAATVPADSQFALLPVELPSPPLTSLIPFPPSEGQTLIEQLLLPSTEGGGGGSLWSFLHSLNSFLALQPPSSSIVSSLTSRMAELEGLITAVQEGKLSPPAFLSPCCHLLNSLCNISMVSADLSSLSLIPRPTHTTAADPAQPAAPPKMRATDEIIVQLLHVFLILLRASPWCRLAAIKSPPSASPAALLVPSTHRPHPLAQLLNSPRLFVRQPAGKGRRGRESEDHAMNIVEEKEKRAEEAAVERGGTFPELVPLLLSIVQQQQQRGQPRHHTDAFLQPTLRLLLLLLQSSPRSLDVFLPLLSKDHLFPLLRLSTSPVTRCLAVQLFALCLEDPSTLCFFPHPLSTPSANGRRPLSLLEGLYNSLFDEEDPVVDDRPQPQPQSRLGRQRPNAAGEEERAKREVHDVEARLWLRLHVVRILAFVAERYGDEGIRWLVNERPDPLIPEGSSASAGDEEKQQMQPIAIIDRDRYSLIAILVKLLTDQMQHARTTHHSPIGWSSSASSASQPSVESAAARWRDRRMDGQLPASQPDVAWGWQDASRTLSSVRVQVVVEGFRVLCHLIFACIPAPHARPPPMSLPSQLSPCVHGLLALLTSLSTCKESSVAALGKEVASLRAVLSAKKLLDTVDLYSV